MANLPLAFAELLAGGVLITAGATGSSLGDVVKGTADPSHPRPLAGSSGAGPTPGASGGPPSGPDPNPAVSTGRYVNPFPGAAASRVDQGVDYTITKPVVAPGRFVVKHIGQVAGFGTYIAGQLLDGPLAGRGMYFAEGLAAAPGVRVGTVIDQGKPIAVPAGHGVIESGWADTSSSWYQPLARASGGYSEGQSTAAGASFNRFVQALGGPLGHLVSTIRGSVAGLHLP